MNNSGCLVCYFNMFTAFQLIVLFTDEGPIELGRFPTTGIDKIIADLCEKYNVDTVRLIGDHTYLDRIAERVQEAPTKYELENIKKIKTEIY